MLVALVGVEVRSRQQPVQRVQRVQSQPDRPLSQLDGVPVWPAPDPERPRDNLACGRTAPEGTLRVALVGDSILYGVDVPTDEAVAARLQALLEARRGPTCVSNVSRPAFTWEQQLAVARLELADAPPHVLVWELWHNSIGHYRMVGDTAWNFGGLALDERGLPSVFGLPPGLNEALFERSAAFRTLTLGRAPRAEGRELDRWRPFAERRVPEVLALAEQLGSTLVVATFPPLSRSFEDSVARPYEAYAPVREAFAAAGVTEVDVAAALVGEDVEALRLDPCCHYNAAGHTRLAEVLAEAVVAAAPR